MTTRRDKLEFRNRSGYRDAIYQKTVSRRSQDPSARTAAHSPTDPILRAEPTRVSYIVPSRLSPLPPTLTLDHSTFSCPILLGFARDPAMPPPRADTPLPLTVKMTRFASSIRHGWMDLHENKIEIVLMRYVRTSLYITRLRGRYSFLRCTAPRCRRAASSKRRTHKISNSRSRYFQIFDCSLRKVTLKYCGRSYLTFLIFNSDVMVVRYVKRFDRIFGYERIFKADAEPHQSFACYLRIHQCLEMSDRYDAINLAICHRRLNPALISFLCLSDVISPDF